MNKKFRLLALLLALALLVGACAGSPTAQETPAVEETAAEIPEGKEPITLAADYVFTNGKVYTVNKAQPWAEAVAVKGNEIVFVGSSAEAEMYIGENTRVADLEGRLVLPGLIDSHIHGLLGAVSTSGVWLSDIRKSDGVLDAVREYADAHPEKDVIFGWGYSLVMFGAEGPTKELLDSAVADRPVYLIREDGHSGWANSKALELAGVDKDTPDPSPPAGTFGRDAEGNPTGAINGSPANVWMVDNMPGAVTDQSIADTAGTVLNHINELGITTAYDPGAPFATDAAYRTAVALDEAGKLPLRYFSVYYMSSPNQVEGAIERLKETDSTYHSPNFSIIALKMSLDGVVENHKAALWEPYLDDGTTGELNLLPEDVIRLSVEAARAGYDLHLHTLGDRAVSLGLDAAEAVRAAGFKDTHIVFAHCELVREEDFPRFKTADVFINSTGGWWGHFLLGNLERAVLGDRTDQEYPFRYMIDDGVLFVQSSDFPGDSRISPFIHIEGSVTRQAVPSPKIAPVKNPENRLTLAEAIESYTINGATLLRMEDKVGSLEVGKLADFIIVDQNIFEIDPKQIHETQVLMTMLDGKVWHDVIYGWGDPNEDVLPDIYGDEPDAGDF